MKFRILTLLLAVASVLPLVLTGCHGSRGLDPFVMPDEFDTSKEYEISFWAKNDTNHTQVEIYKNAIEEFEKCYPNIKVNLRLYTDYGKIYNDVITNISTATTPNVCITYPDHIATYLTGANTVVPLDELFDNEKYGLGGSLVNFDSPEKDEIIPQFLEECSFDGHYYAIPYMRSTEACYVNKTFVEKLGYELPEVLTWDFVWEVSAAAMEKNEDGAYKVNGQEVLIPFIYKSTDNMMIQMLRQSGGGYSTENGEILLFNDVTKEKLYTIAESVGIGAFSCFTVSGYPANFLNAGQCIFAVDSTAGATWMGSGAPLVDIAEDALVEFETAVMTVPQMSSDDISMISQGPSVCVFNKADPDEVLASWLFAQFLLTSEVQIAYAMTEGYVPVTSKAQTSDEYVDYLAREGEDGTEHYDVKIKASKLLLDNVDNTFVTPVFNGSASLRDAAGQMIVNVTKSVRRRETVDDAYMEKLYKDMISLYRLNIEGSGASSQAEDLGPLPTASVILLTVLALVWVLIITCAVFDRLKKKKTN